MKLFLYNIFIAFIFIGCGSNITSNYNSNSAVEYQTNNIQSITINNPIQIEYFKNISYLNLNINIPENQVKDIYLVTTSHFTYQKIKVSASKEYKVIPFKQIKHNFLETNPRIIPKKILEFSQNLPEKEAPNHNISSKILKSKRPYQLDTEETFFAEYFDQTGNSITQKLKATAKAVIQKIPTPYGSKNLVVWVANNEFNDGSLLSSGTISQEMVDELANTFLQPGDDNDIYDWDSNLYGAEWGDDARSYDSNVIANENTIHILIYDMQIDNLAGFFYAKDNYLRSSEPTSNEKIMFYVNSRMYGKGDEASKKETFTTLVHEFQHMINFYQRWLKKDIQDPTWFNEMLSETTEDLLATKIDYYGPRNVDPNDGSAGESGNRGGRYPYFNRYNYYPVTSWFGDIDDYGRVSAFGAFLIRNYGGAQFLHQLFSSNTTGREALVKITHEKDFNTILNKWGAAVMLSDKTNLAQDLPQYNFGDFKETTLNNITYKMGSINFFNYIPKPTFKSDITAYKDANIYTKIGENLSGKVLISVDIEKGGDVTIIAK